jgi:glutamyl-tRNA synthetase
MAPSPTGLLHIGTARTALFNWLFAKHHGGKFILRIEDTDLERSKKEYEEDIISGLKWLGIDWDGEIFRQTERLHIYKKGIEKLLSENKAFYCYHTKEELEAEQKQQMERKEAPRHVCGHKLKVPAFAKASAGKQSSNVKTESNGGIIRLAVNENSTRTVRFNDEIRGDIEWEERLIGDFSIAKDIDTPLYNFAVVMDDIDMEITHVIRGEDHISNTPKQVLIYEALGAELPVFAHLPLILGTDRSKLSKRTGQTSVNDYKKDYLPEALTNFMGFLGYTYSKEKLSMKEMAEEFELSKVHKSGAIFDMQKLNWINSVYVRALSPSEFKKVAGNDLILEKAIPLITERLEKLTGVAEYEYFWKEPVYEKELLKWKKAGLEEAKASLTEVKEIIHAFSFEDKDALRLLLDDTAKKNGDRGLVYWPLRAALTGKEKSPDPVDVAFVLGKEETLKRISSAIDKL